MSSSQTRTQKTEAGEARGLWTGLLTDQGPACSRRHVIHTAGGALKSTTPPSPGYCIEDAPPAS